MLFISRIKWTCICNRYSFLLCKIALPYPHKYLVWFCGAKRIDRQVFLKEIFLSAGDPLSAHVRACSVLVDRQLLRALHLLCPTHWGVDILFLLFPASGTLGFWSFQEKVFILSLRNLVWVFIGLIACMGLLLVKIAV